MRHVWQRRVFGHTTGGIMSSVIPSAEVIQLHPGLRLVHIQEAPNTQNVGNNIYVYLL